MGRGRSPRTVEDIDADIICQLKTMYKVSESGCWIWTGSKFDNGYGRISRFLPRGKFHMRAHITSWLYYRGEIPPKLFVCHTCDNKLCINPDHLWLGTNSQNQLDASSKGVHLKYWTAERREEKRKAMLGCGNHMFGISGPAAPCYGRTGDKHPMYGKHHTAEAKRKISESLKKTHLK